MSARFILVASLAALVLTGCDEMGRPVRPGPLQHETQSIELDKAEVVRVEMRMGAGELDVDGGSPRLLDAEFDYDNPALRPIVRYLASSFRGQLSIVQPSVHHAGSASHNEWKLHLNNSVPLDLVTHLGAGNAELNLGGLNLRRVEVQMGVGNLDLDLRGDPKRDYEVSIHGGVGNATVRLPPNAGIVADAKGGIGNIDAQGLEKRDRQWVNTTQQNAKVTIHLDVRGGIGNITLLAR